MRSWFFRLVVVFFCKQKTAYELRISDWSSDVCSSDLFDVGPNPDTLIGSTDMVFIDAVGAGYSRALGDRSEEHTSELQSLMRNSYAVFCLKKKNKNKTTIYYIQSLMLIRHAYIIINSTQYKSAKI